jgi:hypothetical protein
MLQTIFTNVLLVQEEQTDEDWELESIALSEIGEH